MRQVEEYIKFRSTEFEVAEAVRKADMQEQEYRRQRCVEVTATLTALNELSPAAAPPAPAPPAPPPAILAAPPAAPSAMPPMPPSLSASLPPPHCRDAHHPLTFINLKCQRACCIPSPPPSPAQGTPPSSEDEEYLSDSNEARFLADLKRGPSSLMATPQGSTLPSPAKKTRGEDDLVLPQSSAEQGSPGVCLPLCMSAPTPPSLTLSCAHHLCRRGDGRHRHVRRERADRGRAARARGR